MGRNAIIKTDGSLDYDKIGGFDDQIGNLSLLAPNGVDDTANIMNALNTKGYVKLLPGTFIGTNLTVGANKSLVGSGVGLTTIKKKANTSGNLLHIQNANNSLAIDFTLDGNKVNNSYNASDSLLRIDTTADYPWQLSNFNLTVERIVVQNGASNGVTLYTNKGATPVYNWVYYLQNITVKNCEGYGLWDNTTDNHYQGFLLSYNGIANAYLQSGNNMYMNFKMEGGGITDEGYTARTEGYNFIMDGCRGVQFTNLDCQTAYKKGAKILNSYDSIINGSYDSNGQQWQSTPGVSQGIGMEVINSHRITGTAAFYIIDTAPDVQKTHCYVDTDSSDISIISETEDRMNILGARCVVSSLSKLKKFSDIGTNFVKAFAVSSNRATGFSKAVEKNIVPENMLMWLDGADFTNTPQTTSWTDKSGNGKAGATAGFAFTATSGSDGSGGVAFDKVDDIVTVPQLLTGTGSYSISTTVKLLDLTNVDGQQILRQGTGVGRVLIGLSSAKKVLLQTFFGGSYDFVIDSGIVVNTTNKVNITVTIDRLGNQKLYINGVLKGSLDISTAKLVSWESASNFLIDADAYYYTKSNLTVYNTVVYDKVLSEKEVLQNYNALIS